MSVMSTAQQRTQSILAKSHKLAKLHQLAKDQETRWIERMERLQQRINEEQLSDQQIIQYLYEQEIVAEAQRLETQLKNQATTRYQPQPQPDQKSSSAGVGTSGAATATVCRERPSNESAVSGEHEDEQAVRQYISMLQACDPRRRKDLDEKQAVEEYIARLQQKDFDENQSVESQYMAELKQQAAVGNAAKLTQKEAVADYIAKLQACEMAPQSYTKSNTDYSDADPDSDAGLNVGVGGRSVGLVSGSFRQVVMGGSVYPLWHVSMWDGPALMVVVAPYQSGATSFVAALERYWIDENAVTEYPTNKLICPLGDNLNEDEIQSVFTNYGDNQQASRKNGWNVVVRFHDLDDVPEFWWAAARYVALHRSFWPAARARGLAFNTPHTNPPPPPPEQTAQKWALDAKSQTWHKTPSSAQQQQQQHRHQQPSKWILESGEWTKVPPPTAPLLPNVDPQRVAFSVTDLRTNAVFLDVM